MGMLKLWRKLPPNTNVSSGVYTAWIHPAVHETRYCRGFLSRGHGVRLARSSEHVWKQQHTATNLMGWWTCCPVWALFAGSHDTCPPRRCRPAFLIKPSSRTCPGSGVSVESARKPAAQTNGVSKWMRVRWRLIGNLWSLHTSWPFLLEECDTRPRFPQSRCGSLWSSPEHS